ncbi:Gfo/Idh/MocA family protein [Kribbella sp. CA-245084]|uniref:Gfo/Idh/MocA family protein n=1 Tax=Kribbella sp. CA-245084 TaxID=3239940 RepID=UPI003D92B5E1
MVRWGLLSTAAIGRVVVDATAGSSRTRFVAVASREVAKAQKFADECGLELAFGSYDELLASPDVDAVYVALPVALHTEWTLKALAAGKHVLTEKPFATSASDASRCFDAAVGVNCVEGLMYRHHPQTLLARRLVAEGAIGRLTTVRAALSVSVGTGDIRRSRALGGGALLDLGCYCVSAIRLFAGKPERVYAEQVIDTAGDGVDLRLAATLRMPDDVLAQLDVGLDLPRRDELELIGTAGKIVVGDPWVCRDGGVELVRDGVAERVPVDPEGSYRLTGAEPDVYRIEFETVSAYLSGEGELGFGREDAVEQARVLEQVRQSAESGVPVS